MDNSYKLKIFFKPLLPSTLLKLSNKWYRYHGSTCWGSGSEIILCIKSNDAGDSHLRKNLLKFKYEC